MSCTAERREQVRRAADRLAELPCVYFVDALAPDAGEVDQWTVSLILTDDCRGIPDRVLSILGDEGLTLRPRPAQGPFPQAVATA